MLREVCRRLINEQDGDKPTNDNSIRWVVMRMEENYCDPNLSIAGLAESAGLSDARLSQLFKNAKKTTPKEYLTQLCMKKARVLLHSTAIPVKDIALQIGYLDVSSFIRRFRIYVGVTPLQYRQSHAEASRNDTRV